MSHPSRVRELKQVYIYSLSNSDESHPSRVRELKLCAEQSHSALRHVAPLPGA